MKREADSYITSQNWQDETENETEEDLASKPFKKASEAVISQRQIRVPKRRAAGATASNGTSTGPKNAFAGFSFGATAPTNGGASSKPPSFSLGLTPSTVASATIESKTDSLKTSAVPAFSFGSNTSSIGAPSANSSAPLIGSVAASNKETTVKPSFSFGIPSSSPSTAATTNPVTTKASQSVIPSFTFGAPAKPAETQASTPSFGEFGGSFNKTVSESPLSISKPQEHVSSLFSPPPPQSFDFKLPASSSTTSSTTVKESSSLTKQDIENLKKYATHLRGLNESLLEEAKKRLAKDAFVDFSDLFNQYIQKRKDLQLKHADAEKILKGDRPPQAISVSPVTSSVDTKPSATTSVPSFVAPPKPPAGSSNGIAPFSFGSNSKKSSESSSGFAFKPPVPMETDKSTADTAVPAFKPPTPALTTVDTKAKSTPSPVKPASLGFSFGNTASTPSTETSTPSFQAQPSPSAPITASAPTPQTATASSGFKFGGFGGSSSTPAAPSTPSTANSLPSSGFSFGAPAPNATTASTNTSSISAPTFSFGSSSTGPSTTGFSFGSGSTGSTGFSFGAKATDDQSVSKPPAPTFSFGASSTPASSTAAPSTSLFGTATGFGASTPGGSSLFAFKPPAASTTEKQEEDGGDEDAMPAEEQIGDALMKGAGEESEETLHEVRAKLFVKKAASAKQEDQPEATSPSSGPEVWVTVGLGLLKVNKNKESGKTRLLLRADTSGRVLLNSIIFKEMPLTRPSEKDIFFMATDENGELKPHQVRVKTKDISEELMKVVQKAKSEAEK